MAETWQLQDAKSRFCELVDKVRTGPQFITRRGKPVAVVISEAEYDKLSAKKIDILDFFRSSPLRDDSPSGSGTMASRAPDMMAGREI